MQEQLLQHVEDVWHHGRGALDEALAEAIDELENLLRLDEYHRHGHDPDHLERALGPLASTNLDLGSLSRMLGQSTRSRAMQPERLQRVKSLIPALVEMRDAWAATAFDSALIDLERDEHDIRELAARYLDRLAAVFRAIRIAQLETRSKYDASTHDALFAGFDWRQLGPGELRLSPPFVVRARLDAGGSAQLGKLMSLLATGMPIKAIGMRSSVGDVQSAVPNTSVPSAMTIETLPLAMRGVYLLQTHAAESDFQKQLSDALSAPRPAVISILCPRDDEEESEFSKRAERAVRARAFPLCVYDPDRAERFVLCFDLSSNPRPDALWAVETLSGSDREGQPQQVEEAFTFAHFAASEPELATELTEPPEEADDLAPLTEYLGFSRRQRVGKLPFISLGDENGGLVRRVVSPKLVARCSERLHLWRTLQELAGIDNPYVHTTRAALEKEFSEQQREQLESLRQEMQRDTAQREKAAVDSAVRRLVARLTGIDSSGT